jgi:multidrug efflux pump subunit AcrB
VDNLLRTESQRRRGRLSAPSLIGMTSEVGMIMRNASEAVAKAKKEEKEGKKKRRASIHQVGWIINGWKMP